MRTSPLPASVLLLLLAAAPPLPGQGDPPAAGAVDPLAPFERLIGNWAGSGTVRLAGGEPMPWRSRSTTKKVLGGRFVQTEMRIDIAGGPALVLRSYYGFDPSLGRLISYTLGSNGEFKGSDLVSWIDDTTLVNVVASSEGGVPGVSRSVIRLTPEGQDYRLETAVGTAGFAPIVEGKLQHAEEEYAISDAEWAAPLIPGTPVPEPMQRLSRMSGEYRMTGEFSMAPGADAMKISGRERIDPVFGGNALRLVVRGDPVPGAEGTAAYEGLAFLVWDSTRSCFREFWMNNMGETSVQELRFVGDDRLVTTQSRLQSGEPEATRGTLRLDETGAIVHVSMDRMSAGHQPERAFFGDYTKVIEEAGKWD
jgi:hypothetical protein